MNSWNRPENSVAPAMRAVDVLVAEHLTAHAETVGVEVHHEPPWRWPSSAAL